MTGCAARRIRNGALRCTSRMASHCSSVIFWITESQVYPALLTMMSRPPKLSTAVCTNRSAKPVVGDAADAGDGLSARGLDCGDGFLRGLGVEVVDHDLAPSLASFSAISRPMPRPEPETMATLPSRVPMSYTSLQSATTASPVSVTVPSSSVTVSSSVATPLSSIVAVTDAGAGRLAVHRGDGGEAHPIASGSLLRQPSR